MQISLSFQNFKKYLKIFLYAFVAKISTVVFGKFTVSSSCQIPDLEEKYKQLGLIDSSSPNLKMFVEIGANDGETCSNTSCLADRGWRGLYVEPIKDFTKFAKIRHIFNDVSIENSAISESNGIQTIYSMGLLTTLSKDNVYAYSQLDWSKSYVNNMKEVKIQTKTLENVFRQHNIPFRFDLLIIDVEGFESSIVNYLLSSLWRPSVIIIELEDQHQQIKDFSLIASSHANARQLIIKNGYTEFWKDDINTIFKIS
jgi:FkbM family methyltransferase